jgi:hypothetical protein
MSRTASFLPLVELLADDEIPPNITFDREAGVWWDGHGHAYREIDTDAEGSPLWLRLSDDDAHEISVGALTDYDRQAEYFDGVGAD